MILRRRLAAPPTAPVVAVEEDGCKYLGDPHPDDLVFIPFHEVPVGGVFWHAYTSKWWAKCDHRSATRFGDVNRIPFERGHLVHVHPINDDAQVP